MLLPKKTKHRKHHRGRRRGFAKGQSTVQFGDYGIKALEDGWITNRQIEAARIAMTRKIKRGGKVWINVFPDKPFTKKPARTGKGPGKGRFGGFDSTDGDAVDIERCKAGKRFLVGDESALRHLHRHAQRCQGGALGDAGLQHEQLAVFDGELELLGVLKGFFQRLADAGELLHEPVGNMALRRDPTPSGNDVFALGLGQPVDVGMVFAGRGIAGEADTGAGIAAGIA